MRNLRDYSVITAAYWAFTLTDGALHLLVLFYLYQLGYSPLAVVSLFVFYECAGLVTNLVGGWLAARTGLKSTLFAGLALQILACTVLGWQAASLTVPLVMVMLLVSGIAKDLTKMSSKSYIKLVVPESDKSGLLKWVTLLTGSKNALKGAGFFLGGLLLETVGFRSATFGMATLLSAALVVSVAMLPAAAGKSKAKVAFKHIFSADPRINWLSAARLFLFGSRDVWFVFALPIFLRVTLGWSFAEAGGFLAVWVIGYGIVQALAPSFMAGREAKLADARHVLRWTASLLVPLVGIALALHVGLPAAATLIAGLAVFGFLFATDSALHSYLIVSYAEGDKVALNVGFYYTANAMGRLLGTVLSGALFQWGGMGASGLQTCLIASIGFVFASALLCIPLRSSESRLQHQAALVVGSQVPRS